MPQTLAPRSERRAFSRDGARTYRQLNPATGPTRAVRRKQHWRGDISALVHGPHGRAWLYSGTENASGQARVNAKRNARAQYWQDFQRQGELGHALNALLRAQRTINGHRAALGLPPYTDRLITLTP